MFFSDIAEWSDKKLNTYRWVFNIAHLLFNIMIPIVIVANRYSIFEKSSAYKLTGLGFILVILIVLGGFSELLKVLNNMPENEQQERHLKFVPLLIIALLIPAFIKLVLLMLRDDFQLAYSTISWCIYSYIVGVLVEYLVIKYLDAEYKLRREADRAVAVDSRKNRKK